MKTSKNTIILEDAIRYSPSEQGVDFVDETETRFHIPMKLLIRLYEGAKFHYIRNGGDWDEFCAALFPKRRLKQKELPG